MGNDGGRGAVAVRSYVGIGVRLLACCDRCRRWVELDPAELVRRHGEELTTADLRSRLACGACGGRGASLQVNGSPAGAMAGHGHVGTVPR